MKTTTLSLLVLGALFAAACGGNSGSSSTGGSGGTTATGGNGAGGGTGGTAPDTFVDAATGLTWEAAGQPDMDWANAGSYCDGLSLGGATDWRLPTIDELRSIITGCPATEPTGTCGVTDGCTSTDCRDAGCEGCDQSMLPEQGCFWPVEAQGDCGYYWASDSVSDYTDNAWGVGFNGGHVSSDLKTNSGAARCVR